jgi:hypothetical protein
MCEKSLGLIVGRVRHRDVRGVSLDDHALEECIAQPSCRVFQIPPLARGFRSHILARSQEFQFKSARQLRNEGGIGFGFSSTQSVIEVYDRERDAQVVAQTVEQPQKRDRIGTPRNGYAHTISGCQHSGVLNGR